MPISRHVSGLFLVFAVAVCGFLLVWVPPQIFGAYNQIAEFNRTLANVYLAVVGLFSLVMLAYAGRLAYGLWQNSRRKQARRDRSLLKPSQLSAAQKEREIIELLQNGDAFGADAKVSPELRQTIQDSVSRMQEKLAERTVEIVAFGTISSGKSSLLNAVAGREAFQTDVKGGTTTTRNEIPWPAGDKVVLIDTPGLAEIEGQEHHALARRAAASADVVLFVVDGPLKDFEFHLLDQLVEMEKRIIVCLNKEDWFTARDRELLVSQIDGQLAHHKEFVEVIPVRSRSVKHHRVRVLPDGSEQEEEVDLSPDISMLADRMMQLVRHDGRELVLANLLLQSRGMVADAKEQVRTALDRHAREIVDRYMWRAAGVAAISPLPVVDVAAALAMAVKMVLELAKVYQQKMDLDTAQQLVGELGKNLLSIVGTNVATPAVGTAVASMLKTIPGVGTIAGGILQGLVQAVITRWIGNVFIDYFRREMQEPDEGWATLARRKWEQVTTSAELSKLVKTGMKQLRGAKS